MGAVMSLISIWDEMVQLCIRNHYHYLRRDGSVMHKKSSSVFEMKWFNLKWQPSHSSVFEMRCFSWFRNYHRTHRYLRWDGSVGSEIIIALISNWDEIKDGSIVFFESWTEKSSEKKWIKNPRLIKTKKKLIQAVTKNYSTKSKMLFLNIVEQLDQFFCFFLNTFPRNLLLRQIECVVSMALYGIHSLVFLWKYLTPRLFWLFLNPFLQKLHLRQSVFVVLVSH